MPASVTTGGTTETYVYDADGERVAKTISGVTTLYFQGLWEQTVGGASKLYYTFNGQVVAMRDTGTNAVTYLHGDHLGSVSLATNSSGAVVSKQDFDPWGKARGTSTIAQTSLNYTGQRLDGTGLLYYHARYYDPALARFVSADSIIPGQQDKAGTANPQNLNRYAYVNNNPLTHTDPNGHCGTGDCALEGALIGSAIEPGGGTAVGFVIGGLLDVATIVVGVVLVKDSVDALAAATASVSDAPDALEPPENTDIQDHPSQGAAKRAADRQAGWGRHGDRPEPVEEPFHDTGEARSKAPQGPPGTRTVWRDDKGEEIMHHDPNGHYYPKDDTGIYPHYGVKNPDGTTTHHTYPPDHDVRKNRR